MSDALETCGLEGGNPHLPIPNSGSTNSEGFCYGRGRSKVSDHIRLKHDGGVYTNVHGLGNDRIRAFRLVYIPMKAADQKRADEFGSRLKEARTRSTLSLRQLADEVGCSHSVLQKWEKGQTSSVDYVLLRRVAMRLLTTPERLMFGPGEDPWVASHLTFSAPAKRRT